MLAPGGSGHRGAPRFFYVKTLVYEFYRYFYVINAQRTV